jgi:carbon monoxide dehydrogenase subunit G
MRVSAERVMAVDREAVWQCLLAWEDQPSWMADAASVRVVSAHREGPGVRISVRTRILGLPILTDTFEVAECDPPRRLTVVRRGFVTGTGEWRLEPEDHGTRFVWSEEIRMPIPLLGEVALLLYRPILRRLMARSLTNLARALRSD